MRDDTQEHRINELLAGIGRWVALESPTHDAEALQRMRDLVMEDFSAIGVAVEPIPGRDGRAGHLRARPPWGGSGRGILVISHIDTVCPLGSFAQAPMRRDGDRVYGPGVADMKAGVYFVLDGVRQILGASVLPLQPLTILITTDEEVGAPTSQDIIQRYAREASLVLVTEPCRHDALVVARKGWRSYTMEVQGHEAHSGSAPQDGRSAIAEMARHIVRFDEMNEPDLGITVNVGLVSGGTAANTVPGHAACSIVTRFWSDAEGERIEEGILGSSPYGADIRLQAQRTRIVPPMPKSSASLRLFDTARRISLALGADLAQIETGGGSDGNYAASTGTPTLDGLGPIGDKWHSPDEHILASALPRRCDLLRRLIVELGPQT